MFNPAYPFTAELLASFINKEVYHFVKSTYARGLSDTVQDACLISHYHLQSEAERHYNVIPHDRHRCLFDIRKAADLEKLSSEIIIRPMYQSFSKLINPDSEQRANAQFKEHTKRYLHNHTNWDLKGKVTIFPKLRYQLGELYVRMYHAGDEIIIKFEVIENS